MGVQVEQRVGGRCQIVFLFFFRLNYVGGVFEKEEGNGSDVLCAAAAQFLEFGLVTAGQRSGAGTQKVNLADRQDRDLQDGPYPRVRVWIPHLRPACQWCLITM